MQVIEGTWEEIKLREAELAGRELRVIIKSAKFTSRKAAVQPRMAASYGMLKGKGITSEQFAAEKRAEIELEERRF